MKTMVDFEECLKDSPQFRASLEDNEASVHSFEVQLEKLTKLCNAIVDSGKVFATAMGSLSHGFEALASTLDGDKLVVDAISKLCNTLSGFQAFLKVLIDQGQRTLVNGLQAFIRDDIRKVKDTKKVFDKISDDLDNIHLRNAQLPKNAKTGEVEEVENIMVATESCFSHTSLDYAFQINVIQSQKRLFLLETVHSFMTSQSVYFKQGHELMDSLCPYAADLSAKVATLTEEFQSDVKEMEERHTLVQKKSSVLLDVGSKSLSKDHSSIIFEGYLFKRASNAFKTWNRRWFFIQSGKVFYQKRSRDVQTELVDVRLSTVKHADTLDRSVDRRFCFAIVSPTKCWYLQASSEVERKAWMAAMQLSIVKALNNSSPQHFNDNASEEVRRGTGYEPLEKLHPQYLLSEIRSLPGNDVCADCNTPNPKWASINFGIVVCIECSGIHRSLGVHISKVRSITLDDWEPETQKLMTELGNNSVNAIMEGDIPSSAVKPSPNSTRAEKESWIKAKYVEKLFVCDRSNGGQRLRRKSNVRCDTNGTLRSYSMSSPTRKRATSLEKGLEKVRTMQTSSQSEVSPRDEADTPSASSDESAMEESSQDDTTTSPTQKSDSVDQMIYDAAKESDLASVTYALALGANVNWQNPDDNCMTALHQSVFSSSVTCSELLLQNGARVNLRDRQGRGPLHHAALLGLTGHACLFLKRGAKQEAVDENGEDVLKIALKNYQADIVTLLRLAKLSEDMESELGGDETFTNVFRDISTMASQNPEKLQRRANNTHTNV